MYVWYCRASVASKKPGELEIENGSKETFAQGTVALNPQPGLLRFFSFVLMNNLQYQSSLCTCQK